MQSRKYLTNFGLIDTLIYIRNSNGPRTKPCETPLVTSNNPEETSPVETDCFLLHKYDSNQLYTTPLIP